MPRSEQVMVPLAGTELVDAASGEPLDLGRLGGVHVLVLIRHRH